LTDPRPGYSRPKPDTIPPPTVWPAALAVGTMCFAWGFIASPIVLAVGLAIFCVALAGWIGDMRHER
jgi:hypothetical protein